MLDLFKKVVIGLALIIFVGVNAFVIYSEYKAPKTNRITFESHSFDEVMMDKTFEGHWITNGRFEGLSHSHGRLKATTHLNPFLQKIETHDGPGQGVRFARFDFYDSQLHETSFVSMGFIITRKSEFTMGIENCPADMDETACTTTKVSDLKTVGSLNVTYNGSLSINGSALDHISDDAYESETVTVIYNSASVEKIGPLITGTVDARLSSGSSTAQAGPLVSFYFDLDFFDEAGHERRKARLYCFLSVFINAVNIVAILVAGEQIASDLKVTNRFSLITLAWLFIYDFILLIGNFTFGLHALDNFNGFFLIAGSVSVLLLTESHLLYLVWRRSNSQKLGTLDEKRINRKYRRFVAKILGLAIILAILCRGYLFYGKVILVNALVLVPQIFHNAIHGVEDNFSGAFIIGFCATKYLLSLYLGLVEDNVFNKNSPCYWLTLAGLTTLVGSVVVLKWQGELGSKSVYPAIWAHTVAQATTPTQPHADLEDKGHTGQASGPEPPTETLFCVICHSVIEDHAGYYEVDRSSAEDRLREREHHSSALKSVRIPRGAVRTSCGHIFHQDCERTWTTQNTHCPECYAEWAL